MAELKQMSEDDIQGIVSDAVSQAVDFVESEITEDRIKAQRYFDGQVDIGEEEGRSKIVATKVRDTVRAIKPSLMRVFLSSDNPVEYVPSSQEEVSMADQATKYAHYRFQELNGYTLLNDAIHDALVKKTGILKAYWEDSVESKIGKDTRFEHECCHHNFILGEPNCVYCGLSYDIWTGYKIK